MVRLTDLADVEREHIMAKPCEPYQELPWVTGPALNQRRVAIVTTAGLHRPTDKAFSQVDTSYRVLPGDVQAGELTMTHSSVHFDRIGFRQDINIVFPIDRLRELDASGEIASVANYHYSLMGAGWPPEDIEPTVNELAKHLKEDKVDAVCVVPV